MHETSCYQTHEDLDKVVWDVCMVLLQEHGTICSGTCANGIGMFGSGGKGRSIIFVLLGNMRARGRKVIN